MHLNDDLYALVGKSSSSIKDRLYLGRSCLTISKIRRILVSKYKVCVYAICKNEEQFVERWMNSMSEADEVFVLDTGSSDNTVELLKSAGANVTVEAIKPWRFDVARNRSLELVPEDADILVCTDLDELFEPGWREKIENAWDEDISCIKYRYAWSFNPDGSEGGVFGIEKIHANGVFRWEHPVHEILKYYGDKPYNSVYVEGVQLNHYPDQTKSRSQYLPLLELAIEEKPYDDRDMHYLGREYMFNEMWDEAILTLQQHLHLPTSTWTEERCASMRFIARSYVAKGDFIHARSWFYRAVAEAPHLREPYIDFADMLYKIQDWEGVIYMCLEALKIKERSLNYICDAEPWGNKPYDLLSLAYYYTDRYDESLDAAKKANEISPTDQRIQDNIKLILKKLDEIK